MSRSMYYVQECPTCGRSLHVRVDYLGKQVVCQHCHARFEACDPASATYPPTQSGLSLLRRAEQLIEESGLALGRQPQDRFVPAPRREAQG